MKQYAIMLGVYYVFALLAQQSGYVTSTLFVGETPSVETFSNLPQLAFTSIFYAPIMLFLSLGIGALHRLVRGFELSIVQAACATMLFLPIVFFALSVRPSSRMQNMHFRGCAIRVDGQLTHCGFYSALADLCVVSSIAIVLTLILKLRFSNGQRFVR